MFISFFQLQGGMLIAGRSRSENHCPVNENGQAHGPSAASGAEKVPATPGQEQEHVASRPAEPKAVKKAWGRPLQHRDYRGQHWSVQALCKKIRRGFYLAKG